MGELGSDAVVIVDGLRTAQGILGGALRDFSAQMLGEVVVRALVKRTGLDPKKLSHAVFGCVNQQSDAPNIARVIALKAGLPQEIPALSVQRNCASGMQAVVSAAQLIELGEAEAVIAGGVESMSSAPFVCRDLRFGKRIRNSEMIDSLWEGLRDSVSGLMMGETAELLAEEFNLTRRLQDEWAAFSHERAIKAAATKRFAREIVPISVSRSLQGKKAEPLLFELDESIRRDVTGDSLANLRPAFKENGTVTAGNSCPISDGAACLLVTSSKFAKANCLEVLAQLRTHTFVGVDPRRMGLGAAEAASAVLKRAGLSLADMDLVELNEAFAAQYLACEKVLDLDRRKSNVNGGAIALGHPVGATGARLVVTLAHEMKARSAQLGLAALCVGGGQGGAIILERR